MSACTGPTGIARHPNPARLYLLLGALSEWLRTIGLATHALDKPLHHLRKHSFNT
jgi:hypothetical protein